MPINHSTSINIAPNIYRQIGGLAVKENRPLDNLVEELLELGYRVKSSQIDITWLKMLAEAEADIRSGRVSGPYTNARELQLALDELK